MRICGKILYKVGRPQLTIRHMCIACWVPMAMGTYAVHVVHITFQLQQWLQEYTSMLHYIYTAHLVYHM